MECWRAALTAAKSWPRATVNTGGSGLFKRLMAHLESEQPARTFDCTDEERELVRSVALISAKPSSMRPISTRTDSQTMKTIRCTESQRDCQAEDARVLPICAKLEQEISQLDAESAGCLWRSWASARADFRV